MIDRPEYDIKKDDKRVGRSDRRVGIAPAAVGINPEWDDIRERRVGTNERRGRITDGTVGTNDSRVGINITQNQQKILAHIAENQHVTMAELSSIVGISTRKIEANVQKLKAAGLIERVGARKNGHWAVNPQV